MEKPANVSMDWHERLLVNDALNVAQIGCWNWGIEDNTLYWTDEIYRFFGYQPREIVPTVEKFFAHVHPDDKTMVEQCIKQALKGKPYSVEHRVIKSDGSIGWMDDRGEAVFNEKGVPVRMYGIAQDITQRKKVEEALRSSEEQYRELMEISPVAIFVGVDGEISMANQATADLLNVESAKNLVGRSITEFIDTGYLEEFEQVIEQALRHESDFIKEKIILKSCESVDVELNAKAFNFHGVQGIRFTLRDISQNVQREEQYLKETKLESLGVLAGGIAHDFNNILTIILGYLSVARNCPNINDVYAKLAEAENATRQAIGLTKQLLTFAKGGAPKKDISSVKELIQENVNFALHGSNVNSEFQFAHTLLPVEVDRDQIGQVIHNLVINAVQAMPDGGKLSICAENYTVDNTSPLPLKEGAYVRISIKDTGEGIPEDFLANIFDPYFTTKSTGTGLGLTTIYSIIKQHDGYITVDSQVDVGTTFAFYLPVANKEVNDVKQAAKTVKSGSGRVLVMDDEEMIRNLAGDILHLLGYETEFATDGIEAIAKYSDAMSLNKPFAAVILDLTIRGSMGGKETIKKLLQLDPNVSAIVSSGYSDDPVLADCQAYGFKGVVAKPYYLEDIAEILDQVICNH